MDAGAQAFLQKPFEFKELSVVLEKVIDQRKHKRMNVKSEAIAFLDSDTASHFKIVNISKNGLSLFYNKQKRPKSIFELAINVDKDDFSLDKIPCKTIQECTTTCVHSIDHEKMNRLGVKFGEMTRQQTDYLNHFIQNYTERRPDNPPGIPRVK